MFNPIQLGSSTRGPGVFGTAPDGPCAAPAYDGGPQATPAFDDRRTCPALDNLRSGLFGEELACYSDSELEGMIADLSGYELRCNSRLSMILVILHFQELAETSKLYRIARAAAASSGKFPPHRPATGWTATDWGAMYLDLMAENSVWGGGRFGTAWQNN